MVEPELGGANFSTEIPPPRGPKDNYQAGKAYCFPIHPGSLNYIRAGMAFRIWNDVEEKSPWFCIVSARALSRCKERGFNAFVGCKYQGEVIGWSYFWKAVELVPECHQRR